MAKKIVLSEEAKNITVAVAIAVGALFICYGILNYHINKARRLRSETIEEHKRLVLRKDVAKMDNLIGRYQERLYKTSDIYSIRDKITGLAKDLDIDVLSIQGQDMQAVSSYSKMPFLIKLRCSYNQLGAFMAAIESFDMLVKAEELTAGIKTDYSLEIQAGIATPGGKELSEVSLLLVAYCPQTKAG